MKRAWLFFWFLTLIWGSSFMFMRIAVIEVPPPQLAFIRIGIAAIGMNLVMLVMRKSYPKNWSAIWGLIILGLGNTTIPFTLLAWGEQTVESGMTSILQAITPVFTLVIAHFVLADERITFPKAAGIALSFAGIVVLTSRDWASGNAFAGLSDLSGEIAIIIASLGYAIFATYGRRLLQREKMDAVVVSAGTMTSAAIGAAILMFVMPLFGERAPVALSGLSSNVLLSLIALGVVNTWLAYLMFYYVLQVIGAARTSMVTYVVPIVAVTLGAVVLNEAIDARLILGAALILSGIGLVNINLFLRPKQQQPLELAQQATK